MSARRPAALLPITALAALAACAAGGRPFPSLASRPIEKIAIDSPSKAPAPAQAPSDPALDRAVAGQIAAAEASVGPFAAQLAAARAAVSAARGAAPGSEEWVVAQQALSRLDQERGPATIAVASLDQLRIETAKRATPIDTRRLDDAWTRASAIKADQDASYAALANALTPA